VIAMEVILAHSYRDMGRGDTAPGPDPDGSCRALRSYKQHLVGAQEVEAAADASAP
jgi:hypothetical protein